MTLKRYCLLKDGKVIDTKDEVSNGKDDAGYFYFEGSLYFRDIGVYPESIKGKVYEDYIDDFTATSDDIFELAKMGWLAKWDLGGIEEIISTFRIKSLREHVIAFFAPIFENGKIRRYELVWERENND